MRNLVQEKYKLLCKKPSDINEHLSTLKKYASKCGHVTEMGVRWVVSTWALLAGTTGTLISYDINYHKAIEEVKNEGNRFRFIQANVLEVEIEKTDLLFIDTWHVYKQLKKELRLHSNKVRKYIILHDTTTFGIIGEDKGEGIRKALNEFLVSNKEWKIKKEFTNNNGLIILSKS